VETRDLLKQIQRLEFKTRKLTKHVFSGQYKSAFKGRGMAFSEVREYQVGDEIRTIDWNVTARYQSPYVKVFEEERELTVMLLLDISNSLSTGLDERSKRQRMIEIAATLAFSAMANGDKVGAVFYSDEVEYFLPPKKGRDHILLILRQMIEWRTKKQGTSLKSALSTLRNTIKKHSITFIISDFEDESFSVDDLKRTSKRHDLIAISLEEKADFNLPSSGFIQLRHAETGELTWVNAGASHTQKLLQKEYAFSRIQREKTFRSAGVDWVNIPTDQDFIPSLVKLFKQRK
jgi:uncharacterized protein (DUF58 family)